MHLRVIIQSLVGIDLLELFLCNLGVGNIGQRRHWTFYLAHNVSQHLLCEHLSCPFGQVCGKLLSFVLEDVHDICDAFKSDGRNRGRRLRLANQLHLLYENSRSL